MPHYPFEQPGGPPAYEAGQPGPVEYGMPDVGQEPVQLGEADGGAEVHELSASTVVATERMAVQALFRVGSIDLAAGTYNRSILWVSRDNRLGTNAGQMAAVRSAGTLAVLSASGQDFTAEDVYRWVAEANVPEGDFVKMAAALRTWWDGKLRVAGRGLIIASGQSKRWRVSTNPRLDIAVTLDEAFRKAQAKKPSPNN